MHSISTYRIVTKSKVGISDLNKEISVTTREWQKWYTSVETIQVAENPGSSANLNQLEQVPRKRSSKCEEGKN